MAFPVALLSAEDSELLESPQAAVLAHWPHLTMALLLRQKTSVHLGFPVQGRGGLCSVTIMLLSMGTTAPGS